MTKKIAIIIFILIGAALVAAWYFLWYKPSLATESTGDSGSNASVPANSATAAPRMTAIQANTILNQYAVKDSLGYSTINFNGTYDKPNLSPFPVKLLRQMLENGWWLALLTGGTLDGYKAGDNGYYLVSIYDVRNATNPINTGKSGIEIPASLSPYLIV